MSRAAKTRALIVCCLLAACFTAFSARLVHLQVTMNGHYRTLAAEAHGGKEPIFARRGAIVDVHGEPLAHNEPIRTVIADGSLLDDHAAVAAILAPALGLDEPGLLKRLGRLAFSPAAGKRVPDPYIVLKKKVSESAAAEIAAQLSARKLRGIRFEPDSERLYPNGSMLCHVLGVVNSENTGLEGIELNLERYLRGQDGFRYIERSRTGAELVPYRGDEHPPRDGYNVRLTIDLGLQQIVETELDVAVKQYRPKNATIILMRPQTGEVLAMASRPHFDLNDTGVVPPGHRRNRAIADQYEPGSVFKIVPVAAALQQKLVRPDTYIYCENGYYIYGGRRLKDHGGHGDLSVEDVVMKSSNIGVAKLAIQLGDQKFYEYVRRFGFGEPTGINLPFEILGDVHPPHVWSKISITRIPMGQGICVTPLQMATAMCVIANGGQLMLPQIVREITDPEGRIVHSFQPSAVRRVISEETAAMVRDALVKVVSPKGTARLAHISGFKVAGKTGTAEKASPRGGYEPDKWIVSFAGFLPAEAPEFVALILLDDAQTKREQNYGGVVAAPIFSRIGEKAARYLNLVPTPEPPPGEMIANQGGSKAAGLRH